MNEYPIAERFTSLQGEGTFSGTRMHFIRLAGCNVGRYLAPQAAMTIAPEVAAARVQHPRHSVCVNALGQSFLCDTDYFQAGKLSVADLIQGADAPTICLTGGEPLMHKVEPLVEAFVEQGFSVHVETSGTVPIPEAVAMNCWVTCSPKQGFLEENQHRISEYKFVVGAADGTAESILERILKLVGFEGASGIPAIYIMPISGVTSLDANNFQTAIRVVELAPSAIPFALCVQLHKVLGLR